MMKPSNQEWRDFIFGVLQPGIGLKRWILLFLAGTIFVALGFAFALSSPVHNLAFTLERMLTFGGLPAAARGLIFVGIGVVAILIAVYRLLNLVSKGNRLARGQTGAIATLYRRRHLDSGPKIVAIGGGTGLSALLRGLKEYSTHITAIVAITDDGGSSGRLRSELGIPPPGDARACLVALSDAEPFVEELFKYRFNGSSGLGGHSLGNLMLAALSDMEKGFQNGLDATTNLLGLHGRVVPVSEFTDVVLMGETESGECLVGESAIGDAPGRIVKVWLEPKNTQVNVEAIKAVESADIIVIGPGSLYTSILPNFLVDGLRQAVQQAPAPKLYVCNVATQWRETNDYGADQHLAALRSLGGVEPTHILVNTNVQELPKEVQQKAIAPIVDREFFHGEVVAVDLVDEQMRTRHDPKKLAQVIMDIAGRRGAGTRGRAAAKLQRAA